MLATAVTILTAIADARAQVLTGSAQAKDGDSLFVGAHEIRLSGVDAPEWRQECVFPNGVRWRCGRAAAAALASLVAGQTVSCADTGERSYKRIVAICYVAGADLGERLVALGWAIDEPEFSGGRYAAAEAEARAARRGAWAVGTEGGFERPAAWRRTHKP